MTDWSDLRRRLHGAAETAHDEAETARIVRERLDAAGIDVVAEDLAGHGILARSGSGRPHLLLRADLDALPMQEATGVDHAADTNHHSCGHDGHMAMLLAAATDWDPPCTVWWLFQPAEETGEGMAACLADDRFPTDLDGVVAFHNVPGHDLGTVLVRDGTAAVASTGLTIHWEGRTSHAAEPDAGANPIPLAAQLVPIVLESPRHGDEAAVASLVEVRGGAPRFGTSAGDCSLSMTLRAGTDDALDAMIAHVVRSARDQADGTGIKVEHERIEPFPATINHPDAVEAVRSAANGLGLPLHDPGPFPWSEDFGHATARWPGVLVGVGSGTDQPALHAPDYDFPDDLIPVGRDLWRAIVTAWEADHA